MIEVKGNRIVGDIVSMLKMTAFLILATIIGYIFRHIGFPETNIVLAYLLGVLMTARYTKGYIYGIAASVISIFAFNFFFTEPLYTFAVNNPSYIVTFIVMMIAALFTSTLTSHVKKSAFEAREKESETKALYMLTNRLTDAQDVHDIAGITAGVVSDVMRCAAACLCFDENRQPETTYVQQTSDGGLIARATEDADAIKSKTESAQTGYYKEAEYWNWIIYGRDSILGIIRIPADKAELMTEAQTRLLSAMTESVALAMDRIIVARQKMKYQEKSVQEHYRGNLLRAISHDLRTPLSGIMGTSEIMMDMSERDDPRYELAKQINVDADWLHSLVENILSLTKLQEGKLLLNKQLEAVEEVVGGAVRHVTQRSPDREIAVNIPDELLFVPMDARLIEQVLINLLDNAIKHTSPENEISVRVTDNKAAGCVRFTVADRGEGIREADLPNIFQLFYTTPSRQTDSNRGMGLGLSICDAVVKAHGGTIEARNRADGNGAEFIFTLPMEVKV